MLLQFQLDPVNHRHPQPDRVPRPGQSPQLYRHATAVEEPADLLQRLLRQRPDRQRHLDGAVIRSYAGERGLETVRVEWQNGNAGVPVRLLLGGEE